MRNPYRNAFLSLIVGLMLLLVVLWTADGDSRLAQLLGRLHPSLVHFPIGVLLVGLLVEVLTRQPRFASYGHTVPALLFIGAWTAIGAGLVGLLLAETGGYAPETVLWHQRLGITIAVLAVAAFGLYVYSPEGRPGPTALTVMALLVPALLVGGHLGGRLTHGDGYLTAALPAGLRAFLDVPPTSAEVLAAAPDPGQVPIYAALIAPILTDRCTPCHNAENARGGLRLDTPEGILEGADDGPAVVALQPADSPLMERIMLPLTHDKHMPPAPRPQVTPAEAALLRWWVETGASFELPLAEAEATATVRTILEAYGLNDLPTGIFALGLPMPDSTALAAAQASGLSLRLLAEEVPFVQAHAVNAVATLRDRDLDALAPIADHLAWLDLSRTALTDSALARIGTFAHLTRLNLSGTAITDAGLDRLGGLAFLESLNLYGTAVTDSGLVALADLPALRSLYLWQTKVTPAAAEALRAARPPLKVHLGIDLDTSRTAPRNDIP